MMKRIIIIAVFLGFIGQCLNAQSAKDNVINNYKEKEYEAAAAFIPDAVKAEYKNLDFIILCGDIYFELEKLDSALIMYKKADGLESGEPKILRKIGRTLSNMGKHKEAIQVLQEAIKEDKKDVYSLLELGQAYIAADSLGKAEQSVTKARELKSSMPEIYVTLGDLYYAQRIYELAKNNYEEALSLDENLLDARVKLAISYYWLANREIDPELANTLFGKSLKEWNTITKMDPKNAKAWFEQGKISYFSKRFTDAAISFNEYIKLRPSGSLGRWYLAQSYYEVGACDSAAPHLEIVSREIDTVKVKALLLLARCYFDSQKYKESAESFAKIKLIDTLDAIDLERYGAASFMTGDTVTAIANYKEAIEKDPTRCKLMYKLGRILMFLTKDYPGAIYVFNKELQNCEDTLKSQLHYFIGVSYLLSGNAKMAKDELKQSLAMGSDDLKANLYLGDSHASLGEQDSAITQFEYVIDKSKDSVQAHEWELTQALFKLSGIYLEKKQYIELKKSSTKWTNLLPESPWGWLYLAVSYQGQNDLENACKYYKKVLTVDPKNEQAKKYIKMLNCP